MEEKLKILLEIGKYLIIVAATVIIVLFFVRACSDETQNTIYVKNTDTVFVPMKLKSIFIHDTVKKIRFVYLPEKFNDSSSKKTINYLLAQRDSLSKLLDSQKVEIVSCLDTILQEYHDTVAIRHWDLTNDWLFEMKYGNRMIPVAQNTTYLPLQVKQTAFYEHPIFTGIVGLTIGIIGGVLINQGGK